MKSLLSITLSLFTLVVSGQSPSEYETKKEYYDDGSLKMVYKEFNGEKVDTLKAFDSKGRLEAVLFFGEYGSTDPIYREDYYYNGPSRKTTGYYYMEPGSEPRTVGVQKTYWKNGALMDSVIYDSNGNRTYRARFGKKGELQFEN
jgi:antitoxin component YwqK of YwqJK toxin-antitoxin module